MRSVTEIQKLLEELTQQPVSKHWLTELRVARHIFLEGNGHYARWLFFGRRSNGILNGIFH